jgi:hypothetical protein
MSQLTPFALILLVVFGRLVLKLCRSRKTPDPFWFSRIISNSLQILNFLYFSVAASTLSVFDCQFNGIENVMSTEPSIGCSLNDPVYSRLFHPALIYLGFYIIGVPLLFLFLLFRNRTSIRKQQNITSINRNSLKIPTAIDLSDIENRERSVSSPNRNRAVSLSVEPTEAQVRLGFLYESYTGKCYYWSVVVVLR